MQFSDVNVFIESYEKVRLRTLRVIDAIPEDKMDWTPIPGKFTFADLVRHLAAIERLMFAENVQAKPSRYAGCGKELADGRDAALSWFHECHEQSMAIFSRLTPEELNGKCVTPAGAPITTWKWLRLLPEHEIHHRGQMYTYLGLLGVPAPPLYGMTSEQVAAASNPQAGAQ